MCQKSNRHNSYNVGRLRPTYDFADMNLRVGHGRRDYSETTNNYKHTYSKRGEMKLTPSSTRSEFVQPPVRTNFYEDEFRRMVASMDNRVSTMDDQTLEALEELLHVSELADETLQGRVSSKPGCFLRRPASVYERFGRGLGDLLNWKQYEDERHELFMLEQREMQLKEEYSRLRRLLKSKKHHLLRYNHIEKPPKRIIEKFSCGEKPVELKKFRLKLKEKPQVPYCWHFIRGYCKRGNTCDFQHISKASRPDSWKVFLGGLPRYITAAQLIEELAKKGYHVINEPKIFRGFSPQVCLGSSDEAHRLLKKGKIVITGSNVEVRPYQAFTKKEFDRQLDINKRSVFLGGLPAKLTVSMLKSEMSKLGVKVVNRPIMKTGYAPKVTLATVDQAWALVAKCTIEIYGVDVDVRPFVVVKNQPEKME